MCEKVIKILGGSTSGLLHTHQKTIHKKFVLKRISAVVETESGSDSNCDLSIGSSKKRDCYVAKLKKGSTVLK